MTQSAHPIQLRVPLRSLLLAGSALALMVGLAACGTSKASSSGPSAAPLPSDSRTAAGQRGAAPAAYGMAAAISGNTVEVQDPATGQVTVNFTAQTGFSQTRAVTVAALAVGDCVTAIGQRSSSSSASPAPTASSSNGNRAGLPTSFAAASVSIAPAVNGSCVAAGFGGGLGNRPSGSGRPTGPRPTGSGRPSGGFGGGGGGFGGGFGGATSGKLTKLSGNTMLVQVTGRADQSSTLDTISLTASTSYSETAKATSTALKVGECVTATGSADSTGAVTATRIALSTPGPNGCTVGFGRRPQAGASTTGA